MLQYANTQMISSQTAPIINKTVKKIKNLSKSPSKLNKITRIGRWTPEARAKQAARIRLQKPWEHSTGPKTAAGKKKVSRNSVKHGHCSARTKRFKRILRDAKKYLKYVQILNREARERRRLEHEKSLKEYRQMLQSSPLGIPAKAGIQNPAYTLDPCFRREAHSLHLSRNFQHRPARIRLAMRGTMSNLFP